MNDKRQEFLAIKKHHHLKDKDIAEMLDSSFHSVRAWGLPEYSVSHRNIPASKLHLLKLLLNQGA